MATNNRLIRYDPDTIDPYPTEMKLCDVPLAALRYKARAILSTKLNPPKILLTEEGLPRDWRGILHYANLHPDEVNLIHSHHDPMASVLQSWSRKESARQNANLAQLIAALEVIDRFDVADDIKETLEEDAKFYIINKHTSSLKNVTDSTKCPATAKSDADILTVDDVTRSRQNLPPQFYDAFILFADEDIDFATEIITKMEKYGLKLCAKERDIVGGVQSEYEAICRLISERCNRLIVIFSPAFLESPANTFFANFATALGIDQKRRKIIPCLYQKCEVPPTLSYCFLLKYQNPSKLFNFWVKLRETLLDTPDEVQRGVPRIMVTEPDSPAISESNLSVKLYTDTKNYNSSPLITPRRYHDKICGSQSVQDITITLSDENHNPQLARSTESCVSESTRIQIMPPRPRMRCSTSVGNLQDAPSNGTLMYSNTSLHGSTKSVTSTKKMSFLKKLLSPNRSNNTETKEKTKKKSLRKKLATYS